MNEVLNLIDGCDIAGTGDEIPDINPTTAQMIGRLRDADAGSGARRLRGRKACF